MRVRNAHGYRTLHSKLKEVVDYIIYMYVTLNIRQSLFELSIINIVLNLRWNIQITEINFTN